MARRWTNDLTLADATPEAAFWNRRQIIAGLAGTGLAAALGSRAHAEEALEPNTWEEVTSYCNFYEFGTGKGDPSKYAGRMTIKPWSIKIDGLVDKPGDYSFEQILGEMTLEERIYRFRCVEAWSMVVPWNGVELADVLDRVGPVEGAKGISPIPEMTGYDMLLAFNAALPGKDKAVLDVSDLSIEAGKVTVKATSSPTDDISALQGIKNLEESLEASTCFKNFTSPESQPSANGARSFTLTIKSTCNKE